MLGVDLTPMIDIVFQLLIFFLTTAQMVEMSRADVELPLEPGQEDRIDESSGLVVNLPADGTIVIGQQEVSLDELEDVARATLLRAQDSRLAGSTASQPRPLVRADRSASASLLNEVLRRLQRAGFASVRVGTSPPGGGGR
jgi:biopolymer transport protein ExbD